MTEQRVRELLGTPTDAPPPPTGLGPLVRQRARRRRQGRVAAAAAALLAGAVLVTYTGLGRDRSDSLATDPPDTSGAATAVICLQGLPATPCATITKDYTVALLKEAVTNGRPTSDACTPRTQVTYVITFPQETARAVPAFVPEVCGPVRTGSSTGPGRSIDEAARQLVISLRPGRTSYDADLHIELFHCGVTPPVFDGRTWRTSGPSFDATNAPSTFSGSGSMTLDDEDHATYRDRRGAELRFVPNAVLPGDDTRICA